MEIQATSNDSIALFFSDAMAVSEEPVMTENRITTDLFQHLIERVQLQMGELTERNQMLCEQLVASESRQQELVTLHQAELQAVRQEMSVAKQEVATLRQEVLDQNQKIEKRLMAETALSVDALQLRIFSEQARVAAAQEERDQAVERMHVCEAELARQAQCTEGLRRVAEAQVSSLQYEARGLRQELAIARDVFAKREQRYADLSRIQETIRAMHGVMDDCAMELLGRQYFKFFYDWIRQLEQFVREKKDSLADPAEQEIETQFLENMDQKMVLSPHCLQTFREKVAAAKSHLVALVIERKQRRAAGSL